MNPALRRTGIVALLLLAAIFIQLNRVQFIQAETLTEDSHNARTEIDEYAVPRGEIIATGADGDISIAKSEKSPAGSNLAYYRTYPEGKYYGNLTGFKSRFYGTRALEYAENSILNGSDSLFLGDQVKSLFSGEQILGGNVYTTTNADLQESAYDLVEATGVEGAAVVLEPTTGRILAEVSIPGYDPSDISSNDSDTAKAAYNSTLKADGNPMADKSRSEYYAPGSTFKTVTASAFIKYGYGDANTMVPAGNSYQLSSGHTITNESDQCPNAQYTLKEAFAKSCNTTFAALCVEDITADQMVEMATAYGMGTEFSTPLSSEASETGDLTDASFRAQSCFGQQDVRMTPLQNAVIAATIANDGERMAPNLIDKITDQNGSILSTTDAEKVEEVLTAAQAAQMQTIMESVIEDGTGTNAQISGYTVGGKTGTAENNDANGNEALTHGWFIGWAQNTSGESVVAVSVFLKNYGDAGSGLATTIGGQLMSQVLTGDTESSGSQQDLNDTDG